MFFFFQAQNGARESRLCLGGAEMCKRECVFAVCVCVCVCGPSWAVIKRSRRPRCGTPPEVAVGLGYGTSPGRLGLLWRTTREADLLEQTHGGPCLGKRSRAPTMVSPGTRPCISVGDLSTALGGGPMWTMMGLLVVVRLEW